MKKLILILFFFPTCAFGEWFEPFDRQDWILQGIYTAVTVVDWMQTREFKKHPNLKETNSILGQHPDNNRIDTFIFIGITSFWASIYAMPIKYRPIFQTLFIVLELDAIQTNHKNGIRITVSYGF